MGELKPVDLGGQRWEDEACSVGPAVAASFLLALFSPLEKLN